MPDNVTFARGGIRYIKSKTDLLLGSDEVQEVIDQIDSGRLEPSLKTNRQHI